jgi:DNA replication and repair protein RecF
LIKFWQNGVNKILSQRISESLDRKTLFGKTPDMTEVVATDVITDKLMVNCLTLTNFRCYSNQRLEVDGRSVILTGANGAGKTNLLEALSFLVPGRGMRRSKLSDVGRRSSEGVGLGAQWAVSAKVAMGDRNMEIGTGCEMSSLFDNHGRGYDKRVIKIDGAIIKNQSELGHYISAQWLTPQMDRLFLEGSSGRRRFLDQLIYCIDPEHASPVAAYDRSVRSRNKLLREGTVHHAWLSSIEESIARHGVAISVRRLDVVKRLQAVCQKSNGAFPGSTIYMVGQVEKWLLEEPALVIEDRLRAELRASRQRDADSGSTSVGPHRSDFRVCHGDTGMDAEICSTGEQKALLIGIILAIAKLQTLERGCTPLLLLDEIAAHLDNTRLLSLFELILEMGAQAWITGTDSKIFSPLGEAVQRFTIENAEFSRA